METNPVLRREEAFAFGNVGEVAEEQLAALGEELERTVQKLEDIRLDEDRGEDAVSQDAVGSTTQLVEKFVALVGEAPGNALHMWCFGQQREHLRRIHLEEPVPLLGAALHDQHGQPATTRTDIDHHLSPQREAGELRSDVVEDQALLAHPVRVRETDLLVRAERRIRCAPPERLVRDVLELAEVDARSRHPGYQFF
jgi:hypothetical protein